MNPLIPASVPVVGGVVDNLFRGRRNRKAREFTLEMYNRQIADRKRFWDMQNKYNLPSNQMARLKAAGLNPNLVYGSGTSATAGSIDSPTPQSYSPESLSVGNAPTASVAAYNASRLADAEVLLKKAQAASISSGRVKTELETDILQDTKSSTVGKSLLDYRSKQMSVESQALSRSIEDRLYNSGVSLDKAVADAVYSSLRNKKVDVDREAVQSLIRSRDVQTLLDKAELQLRKSGNSFRDPLYLRHLGTVLQMILRMTSAFGGSAR